MNALADTARQKFDHTIEEASLKDSVWDPAHFADQRIDALLHETVPSALERLLAAAGAELAAISPDFAPFGEALACSAGFEFPAAMQADAPLAPPAPLAPIAAKPKPAADAKPARPFTDFPVVRTVTKLGERAGQALWEAGAAAERTIQSRTGLYERLRSAAAARVAARWMGNAIEPRPVLAQVTDLIDSVCGEARTSIV